MPPSIEQHIDAAVLARRDDNRLDADPASKVVAWVSDLALVPNVYPRLLKDYSYFLLVEQRVGVYMCMHAEVRALLLYQIGTCSLCQLQCCMHGQVLPVT